MTTHEAGWAHAAGALDGPSWLRVPDDVNALHPLLWSGTARRTDDGGGRTIGDPRGPHGKRRRLLPRAARSHSASVGSRPPSQAQ